MNTKTKNFSDYFEEFCAEAYSKGVYNRIKDDAEYIDACKKHQLIYDRIKHRLGDDNDLIDEFDSIKNYSNSFQCKSIYQQGFNDCVYLLKWIGLI